METTLRTAPQLPRPLQGLIRWWQHITASRPLAHGPHARGQRGPALAPIASLSPVAAPPARTWQGPVRAPSPRPQPQPTAPCAVRSHNRGSGRMVIAGRMADVCAELDRLAALELSH